ncbi:TraB/GumN family protein [Sphingomonas psychrotolerans]|uniref:TraB/GumN family protein n=1 Tax=Sphingomonas psychrotolerans TaxID=1327635 RepID=A0ABU3N6W3_9SPHN|nr:TraB/GumN family protein [Sphingomonas psychrotolerans]MDT8759609.1 TraB/GumN family protein [Sphingomonas psychrotolerans]
MLGKLLIGAALLALCGCHAKQAANDADPALWVVRDADTNIYLFGTVHLLKPGLRWFDDGVKKAFEASDELVLELVMPPQAEMQALVTELGMTTAGPALPDQLSPAEAAKFRAALPEIGLAPDALDRAEPWLAATMLSAAPLRQLGYDDKDGAEAVLTAAAKAGGKKVEGLETAREQLGYFDRLPLPAQRSLLVETLDDLPTAGATIDRMVARWSKGDADGIARLMNEDLSRSPELADALLAQRNAKWADWLAQRMKAPGTVFVAVGAGHLAGNASVQAELAKRGLKVERIHY